MLKCINKQAPKIILGIFLLAAGCTGFSFYLQYVVGLEPCVMCLLQRYAIMLIALVALLAWLIKLKIINFGLLSINLLLALAGLYVAVKQTLLQINPPEVNTCGRDLYGLYQALPFGEFFEAILSGKSDCSQIDWSFLGLSLANYGILFFAFVAIVGLVLLLAKFNQ